MADKGCTILVFLKEKMYTKYTPIQRQKEPVEEVLKTPEIAKVRIHVERSIGRVQNNVECSSGRVKNFKLFDGVLPMNFTPIELKCFRWLVGGQS